MKLLKLVPDDTNIKFLKWRVPFYIVSVMLMILSWVAVFTMGLNYGVDFAAALAQDNVFATQFHPEKSHTNGLQLLSNFLAWDGRW